MVDTNVETSESPEMKITALAPWFGNKRTLAPKIVMELGDHSAYWEPFVGGFSIIMQKPVAGHETVNDLHGDVINLARVVRNTKAGSMLFRRLRRVWLHEHVLAEAWDALAQLPVPMDEKSLSVDRAFHYFIASWSGRNGFAGTRNVVGTRGIAVRWTPGGGGGGQRFMSAVESIPAWRHRMRRLVILQRDAFEVISKIEDVDGVAIYVDPPYLSKDGEYEHDFSDGFMTQGNDHERLATALQRFKKARVVVSYYDAPALKSLYPGWTIRDVAINKGTHNAGRRGGTGTKAPEVLLINGPSYAYKETLTNIRYIKRPKPSRKRGIA